MQTLTKEKISEIIEMAWCDKTAFEDIQKTTGLTEKQVICIMKKNLKPSSFVLWRKRVTTCRIKHKVKNANATLPVHSVLVYE